MLNIVCSGNMPIGWTPLAHPEASLPSHLKRIETHCHTSGSIVLGSPTQGRLFIMSDRLIINAPQPIYTDAYLWDVGTLDEINRFLEVIDLLIDQVEMPADWELVLELAKDERTKESVWFYYFVDHGTRALFWLHEFNVDTFLSYLRVAKSRTHMCKMGLRGLSPHATDYIYIRSRASVLLLDTLGNFPS